MRFKFQRARSWALRILILLLLAGGGFGIYRARRASARETVASAAARKGDFLVLVRCRGALKPRRSVGIYTPVVPNLRISWLAPTGEIVKGGDVIMRFDSSTAQQQLMQKQSQLKQAQATLDQAVAQFKITSQQDQTELADAKFTAERADVQVRKDELQGGRIKGDQARVDLGIAQQKLKVQEAAIALHEASFAARMSEAVSPTNSTSSKPSFILITQ
jgi:multidrug efflux pump subunit AcrA (membrane-fusion protein)